MKAISYNEAKEQMFRFPEIAKEPKFKINADYLRFNCWNTAECYREMMVSFFQMLPLIEERVELHEADYILYAHSYARLEDMSPGVLKQLQEIDKKRKEGAEIIVVGKAANIEPILNGSISNITFYESHFAEALGKRFNMDIKDEHMVYDLDVHVLNIWPVNGCLRKCKFCRRSYMNIPFESISLETLKAELDFIKEKVPKALRYIRLRAENLTEYGIDIYGRSYLPELLNLLDSYEEIKAVDIIIGLAVCEVTDEILEVICNFKKFVIINMNPEVGSDKLFELTGKDITRERTIHIFKEVRKAHPNAIINATVMVGFPTEELLDIYELADLIQEIDVNSIFCNLVGIAPKCPLAELPPLSENLREYHIKVLLQLLKKQKRKRDLKVKYPKILKKGKRSTERFKREQEAYWEMYSILRIKRDKRVFSKN